MEQALRQTLAAQFTPECFARFAARFSYARGDLSDRNAYKGLLEVLSRPKTGVCSNIVFYLAVKPEDFSANCRQPRRDRTKPATRVAPYRRGEALRRGYR